MDCIAAVSQSVSSMLSRTRILRTFQIAVAALGLIVAHSAEAQDPSVSWNAAANNFLEDSPTDNIALNSTTMDLQDLPDGVSHTQLLANADVLIGGFSAKRINFETAPILIPEPSTYALVTVGSGICSVWARHRNRAKA